ncbi:hypothetical protein INR49_032192 [Caranx melampygus]|nr:hypothetical protein INR49_032192 [Caranx melampygus]
MDGLRQNLERQGLRGVTYMVVNHQGEEAQRLHAMLAQRLSENITLYKQEEQQPDVWQTLGGEKDDFLIYDRVLRSQRNAQGQQMHSQVQTGSQMSGEMLEMVMGMVMGMGMGMGMDMGMGMVTIMTMVMVMATTGMIKVFTPVVLATAITTEHKGKSKMVGYLRGSNR